MKAEIPVCRRCCCCLPLRYGLLAWGYFKIIADVFSIPLMIWYYLLNSILMISSFGHTKHLNTGLLHLAISIFAVTTFMTDIVVTIVFLVGGHTKNAKLLRGYYFYSIAMLIIMTILPISSVCTAIENCFTSDHRDKMLLGYCSWDILMVTGSAYFVNLALQTYFLLLLRSEIIKLRKNGAIRFVNNAAEAECTMIREEKVAGEETITKDIQKQDHDVNQWRILEKQGVLM